MTSFILFIDAAILLRSFNNFWTEESFSSLPPFLDDLNSSMDSRFLTTAVDVPARTNYIRRGLRCELIDERIRETGKQYSQQYRGGAYVLLNSAL